MPNSIARHWRLPMLAALVGASLIGPARARADGMVVPPKDYKGSLEERAQEAIIFFHAGDEGRPAMEDLILKIRVEGDVASFAWVVALPNEPTTAPEDGKVFEELHRYVEHRKAGQRMGMAKGDAAVPAAKAADAPRVEVISRKEVGSYDVAIVRENEPGQLNTWLADNGYRRVEGAADLFEWYRKKNYVFACVRVNDAAREKGAAADLHPLRFSFATGGRDGVYFPMRLTGLQSSRFDVNLYVLYGKWLNDRLNGFGYAHRGFSLHWRDFDSPKCEPNAGKRWSDPPSDPYLQAFASFVSTVTRLCQKLHPGERYYLTNIRATNLAPRDVREWPDDLWLFPYYTNPKTVPHDVRKGGPASAAYPTLETSLRELDTTATVPARMRVSWYRMVGVAVLVLAAVGATSTWLMSRRSSPPSKPGGSMDL